MLVKSRYLEDSEDTLFALRSVGVEFMVRRLTQTQLPVCPQWDSIRVICRRLAEEDPNTQANFEKYVRQICGTIVLKDSNPIKKLCNPEHRVCGCGVPLCSCGRSSFGSDMISAAIYVDKLSVVDEFSNFKDNLNLSSGVLFRPLLAAVAVNNHAAVDILFAKCRRLQVSLGATFPLRMACRGGDLSMVKRLLPTWTEDSFEGGANQALRTLQELMGKTPSVEVFEMLYAFKKQSPDPVIGRYDLAEYLRSACNGGWKDMVEHLLRLGAPVRGSYSCWRGGGGGDPLTSACANGHTHIARLLLEQGAEILDRTLEETAKRRRWDVVWMLVDEYGADVNTGSTPVIAHAIEQERSDLFIDLLKRGASLGGEGGRKAVEVAKKEGLESMLELLGRTGLLHLALDGSNGKIH